MRGTEPRKASTRRTGPVLARMCPSSRISAIWVMKSSSPARPSPQWTTRSPGPVPVRISARIATTKVRTIENTRADGMNRSTTWLTGRMARESGVPSLRGGVSVVPGVLDMPMAPDGAGPARYGAVVALGGP
ncbi:hypothetical protein CITRIK5_70268 [Citricoccus sp. K5]|nr:hypothetical protein CITRIK5_70268 [Citricoccus sp. K5]